MMNKLAIIIVIASAVVMFWKIDRYPISVSIYEGVSGLRAIELMDGDAKAKTAIWGKPLQSQIGGGSGAGSANNNPFVVYPMSFLMKKLGCRDGYLTLRMVSILYAVASVWMIYLVGSKMFTPEVGLVSAALLGVSSIFLAYSRVALGISAAIFFSLLCVWMLFSIDRPYRSLWYVLLGGLAALATYFYLPARVMFPLIVFSIVVRMAVERGYFSRSWQYLVLLIAGFLISLHLQGGDWHTFIDTNVPMSFGAWVRFPQDDFLTVLLRNVTVVYRGLFVHWGWGESAIAERSGSFDAVTKYALAAGIAWSFFNIEKPRYRFLLLWLAACFLPAVLTTPEVRRAVLVIAPVCLLAAVGICCPVRFLFSWTGRAKPVIVLILAVPVVYLSATLNLDNYFGLYAGAEKNPHSQFVMKKLRREKVVGMVGRYTVYTDLFCSEYGWPQSMAYEARRRGFAADRIVTTNSTLIRKRFDTADAPCVLVLSSGEVEIREAEK